MENDTSYFKFLINEDIYNIREDISLETDIDNSPEPDKQLFTNKTYVVMDVKENNIQDESLSILLVNILNAIGLTKNLVRFIYPQDVSIIGDAEFENCTFIVFYDKNLDFLPDNVPSKKYKIYPQDSNTWLLSDSLQTLNSSRDKKILLWNNLKILFKLK